MERTRREVFEVEGLCCATEARQIEARLGPLNDVATLQIDPVRHRLTVEGGIAPAEVERAIAALGMRARRVGALAEQRSWWERHGRLLLVVVSGIFWALSMAAAYAWDSEPLAAALAVGAVAAGGWFVFPRGVRAALNRALDMNFLMSVAAVGALLIGEYAEAASVLFLFSLAQWLEARSMDRARNAIRSLMDLSPAEATVIRDGREVRVPAESVVAGEVVVVRPGEKIPVDGEVVAGRSSVNQAPITGESLPVDREPGEEVFAGTLNGEGALEVRSTRRADDTTLARIIHAVEEAQATRAPSQAFVDRFARVYTPVVVVAAVALAVVPPLAGLGLWGEWFYRALVLLVVACPCALVISTPVTVVSALTGAARRGILIKGGLHLENAGRTRVVAFDKTGTLTTGEPVVVDVAALDGVGPGEVLRLAAAVERRSEHPIARAVVRHADAAGVSRTAAAETEALPGRGVRAHVDGQRVYVGSERLFRELGATTTAPPDGRARVWVGTAAEEQGVRILGTIAISDRVRPGAADALRSLRNGGIDRIIVLTGDTPEAAEAAMGTLGGGAVDEVRASLLPEDKVAAVRALREAYGRILMVGDGVNDAPALAAADVGVAMGSAGTDVALETADIALMADDLGKLPETVRTARKAERIIRSNIAFALATKAVFVLLAPLGFVTLWMAVLADMGASLLVIGNGLRALR